LCHQRDDDDYDDNDKTIVAARSVLGRGVTTDYVKTRQGFEIVEAGVVTALHPSQ
jgi:hypothetical protein